MAVIGESDVTGNMQFTVGGFPKFDFVYGIDAGVSFLEELVKTEMFVVSNERISFECEHLHFDCLAICRGIVSTLRVSLLWR